ncbi:putative 2-dehydropantoate 2-reductase [Gracilariopsis chorda]|uniref:Putative 2-dehydropantoate 2-reductase n=1 Tax=Gracilariopsis chorda TaxID=448386 RepID=A0A2V3IS25_9FLOR|nr:putative 2-dehydropantoate 2-reductase [Gracilariopsis chorda]|eukprot:PXF44928.1 putative 2-dehydropantoate 2-reductase [Gracilariopsis chorda]
MELPEKARICIVGAGAIGGLLGVELSRRGHHVSFFARGAHLAAMRKNDALQLIRLDGTVVTSAEGSKFIGKLEEAGEQDLVVLGLKMHQIKAVLPTLHHIIGPNTVLLGTQNGIPWWYFQEYSGPEEFKDRTVESADPGGVLKDGIDAKKLIATVVYPAAVVSSPGVIKHVEGIRFPVGEPNGQTTDRVQWVSNMLIDAGFKSPVLNDVRGEMWLKLWGTVAVNPLSALTHATLDVLCTVPAGREVVIRTMTEVEKVANRLGSKMRLPIERRVNGAAKVGKHKTSMLQDVEAGREMEIETIMGAVVEMARVCGEDTPCIDTIYGTIRMLAHVMKEEDAKVCLLPMAG